MKLIKKKSWNVICEVNMCANREESVLVKATKAELAIKKAENELKSRGFFHTRVISCKEIP